MVGGHQEKARYFGEWANCHAGHVKEGGELGCCLEVYICAFTGPLLHKWKLIGWAQVPISENV